MKLEELNIYQISMEISDEIWDLVKDWKYFEKDTIGKQLVRSADSISANISEGFGRFYFKENKNFNYYARGSLYETKTWLSKAYSRKLIDENVFNLLIKKLDSLGIKLNNYIKTIGSNNK
ncbi:MAG: four helix bundle protein [Ignavibacteriae bacterium]|nr:four helix bundle protein [Ignavibacteriota bacterium]NOG99882.1 four helix bundle protein [Ignavibacteriota bacterium]